LAYVLRRLLYLVPTVLGISFLCFALLHLAPGDPAELTLAGGSTETEVSAEALARFRAAYLLDQPLWKQYLHYLGPFDLSSRGHPWFGGSGEERWGGLVLLDFQHELQRPHVAIRDELGRRLAVTVPHALAALLLAYLVALPLGIASALRPGSRLEQLSLALVFALYCVPVFWGGLLLQLAFGATGLDWLPVLASAEEGAGFSTRLERGILPVLALAYPSFAYLSRQMRAGLLEALAADYVRTARAKGLSERLVVLKHALPNALLPVATLFAGVLPALIGGSVVVETIFDLPGMGRYAYEGLQQRDWFIVLATTTLAGLATTLGVLVSDLLTAALDPRIRHGG
jgi:peptide/nickel transport system permease protein